MLSQHTRQVCSARLHSALQCMHSDDFFSVMLDIMSNEGQHQSTDSYRQVRGRTGAGFHTGIMPKLLCFGKSCQCLFILAKLLRAHGVFHKTMWHFLQRSSTNSDKGAVQRAEESLGPSFSALKRNNRGEGAGGTFAPPCCTSREKRFVRAKASYRIPSSQEG